MFHFGFSNIYVKHNSLKLLFDLNFDFVIEPMSLSVATHGHLASNNLTGEYSVQRIHHLVKIT